MTPAQQAARRELTRILVEQLVDDWLAEQSLQPQPLPVATTEREVQNHAA